MLNLDFIIVDFEIKKGWHVDIDATHIHYDPELYKDPLQFNPSRFDVSKCQSSFNFSVELCTIIVHSRIYEKKVMKVDKNMYLSRKHRSHTVTYLSDQGLGHAWGSIWQK